MMFKSPIHLLKTLSIYNVSCQSSLETLKIMVTGLETGDRVK